MMMENSDSTARVAALPILYCVLDPSWENLLAPRLRRPPRGRRMGGMAGVVPSERPLIVFVMGRSSLDRERAAGVAPELDGRDHEDEQAEHDRHRRRVAHVAVVERGAPDVPDDRG